MVTNVVLQDVTITAQTGLTVGNATGIQFKNVRVKVNEGPPVFMHKAEIDYVQE
jgi:Tfp pilus assembly protein FimV